MKLLLQVCLVCITAISCNDNAGQQQSKINNGMDSSATTSSSIPGKNNFHQMIDGKQVDLFILKNRNNVQAAITNYGGRLVSLLVYDKDNRLVDVVAGFDSVQQYQTSTEPYFGATIGRYGNRIAKGKFSLDGVSYSLFTNNGPNTLHGGKKGFQAVVWDAKQIGDSILELSYLSKDMEEGFPGNLQVKVVYQLTDNDELKLTYEASTDKKTVVNLTNHAFFNLNGAGSGTINDHLLFMNADRFTPVDSTLIPTGQIVPVANTPFDFRSLTAIGKNLNANDVQLKNGSGFDHNFVLNTNTTSSLNHAATVVGNKTNIQMDVYTEEPGLQFYGGNFMQSKNQMKGGSRDDFRTAFCLETQHFPDSPNQPSFPSTVLAPGKSYHSMSIYQFSVKK